MTLDEAIERNEDIQMEFLPIPSHRNWEAVQLGIEALKRLEEGRQKGYDFFGHLLPGETKD